MPLPASLSTDADRLITEDGGGIDDPVKEQDM